MKDLNFELRFSHSTLTVLIKWPNDIVLNFQKVGGILAEHVYVGPKIYCVLGLGLNVYIDQREGLAEKCSSIMPPGCISPTPVVLDQCHKMIDGVVRR